MINQYNIIKNKNMLSLNIVNSFEDYYIENIQDIVDFLNINTKLNKQNVENTYAVSLNDDMEIQGIMITGIGKECSTDVGIRQISRFVLLTNGSKLLIAHNHPNDNNNLSESDENVFINLKVMCNSLDVKLVDFICVTENSWNGFVNEHYKDYIEF